jgi:hypothetical protein
MSPTNQSRWHITPPAPTAHNKLAQGKRGMSAALGKMRISVQPQSGRDKARARTVCLALFSADLSGMKGKADLSDPRSPISGLSHSRLFPFACNQPPRATSHKQPVTARIRLHLAHLRPTDRSQRTWCHSPANTVSIASEHAFRPQRTRRRRALTCCRRPRTHFPMLSNKVPTPANLVSASANRVPDGYQHGFNDGEHGQRRLTTRLR